MTELPDRILANWRAWFGPRAEEMAAEVAARARAAVEAWDLRAVSVMRGGDVALVIAAEHDGRPVVCKLNPPDPLLGREARGLAAWRGLCPELVAARDDEDTILMERLDPGRPLADNAGSVDEELRVIGALASRLHAAPQPRVDRLGDSGLAAEWLEALEDPGDRAELERLLEADETVIHTDLHANNVLSHGEEWRVIDPKPYRSSREAEIWAIVDGTGLPGGSAQAGFEIGRRLTLYCEAAGLDRATALSWARLRAEAERALAPRGSAWREELTRVAAALAAAT